MGTSDMTPVVRGDDEGDSGFFARRRAKKALRRQATADREQLKAAVRAATADGVIEQSEEADLVQLERTLGIEVDSLQTTDPALFEEFLVARINSGRYPVLDDGGMLLKRGEIAHAEFDVELMKEQAIREFQGGSSGVSVPLGGGVRYRVGAVRGRSVVVGTQLVVEDVGTLTVTSQRAVFAGSKKSLEFRYDKLVGLEAFSDGLRMNVTNRQRASLFRVTRFPGVLAALISSLASE